MPELEDIVESFTDLEASERLEWLIDFGTSLPALPESCEVERDAGQYIVFECQAPVFFKVVNEAGVLSLFGDVPREAPVARGFVSLLIAAFDGAPAEILRSVPEDLLETLQIRSLLGMQRQRGLGAIYRRLKEA